MHVPQSYSRREQLDVKMTPMIDVVFLLLIFFVCTASFQVAEALLPTDLALGRGPQTNETEPDLEHIVVRGAVTNARTIWTINSRECDSLAQVRELLQKTAAIDATLPVILDVANAVPLGDMIEVYDAARLVGFDRIHFAADQ